MTRKEQAEITRRKIIEAAKELNKEKQINEISVEDITKLANVSKGSFYTYFDRKEDVVEEFMYEDWNKLRKEILESDLSLKEKLAKYSCSFGKIIEDKGKEICRSWIAYRVNEDYKLKFDEETLRLLLGKEDDIKVKTINGLLYGLMLSWAMASDDRKFTEMVNNALPFILDVIN